MPLTGSGTTSQARPNTSVTTARVDDVDRRALRDDRALLHRDDVVGVAAGQVEVVQHDDDRLARLPVEVGQQVEQLDLVVDVEERRRLVQQQQVGVLRERHRDPHPLALPAGELGDVAVGQVGRAGGLQRAGDRAVVLGAPLPEPALVRIAPAADEVADRDAVRRDRRLRQQAEHLGDVDALEVVHRRAVEDDLAAAWPQQPGQAAQQRGLAAGVGADDHGDPPVGDHDVEVADDVDVRIAEREVLGTQVVGHPPRPSRLTVARSQIR